MIQNPLHHQKTFTGTFNPNDDEEYDSLNSQHQVVIATLSESSGGINQLNEASTQNYEFLADDPLIDR